MKKTFKQFLMEIADIDNPTFGEEPKKEVVHPRFSDKKMVKHINNMAKNPKFRFVGRGSQAAVHSIDDPHEQDAVIRTAPKSDAGSLWYQYLSKHSELQSNPFLPKVFNTSKSNSYPSYKIEKLIPINTNTITDNELLFDSLMKRYFTNSTFTTSTFDIARKLERAMALNDYSAIKDTQLIDALQIIAILKQKWKAQFDIHDDNIMWRMTPTGPQLVITDPLWFPDYS